MKRNIPLTQAIELRSLANDEAWKSAKKIVDPIESKMDRFLMKNGVRDPDARHDIIQETIIKLVEHYRRQVSVPLIARGHLLEHQAGGSDQPLAWKMLRDKFCDYCRTSQRLKVYVDEDAVASAQDPRPTFDEIHEINHCFSPSDAAFIFQLVVQRMSDKEIRETTGMGRRKWDELKKHWRSQLTGLAK